MGRPPSITPDVLNKLEHAFSIGCSDLEACLYADISPKTLYNFQNKYPDFLQRKELLKKSLSLKARSNIAGSINKGSLVQSEWYLERKEKNEFSTKTEQDQRVDMTINMKSIYDEIIPKE